LVGGDFGTDEQLDVADGEPDRHRRDRPLDARGGRDPQPDPLHEPHVLRPFDLEPARTPRIQRDFEGKELGQQLLDGVAMQCRCDVDRHARADAYWSTMPISMAQLFDALTKLRGAWPKRGWSYDNRFNAVASTFGVDLVAEARASLAHALPNVWTDKTLASAPVVMQEIAKKSG